ncbi:MAG: MalY/PatB family protein [Clostridia bacterium]|nr:MalY/PatB family protein [Clostridia bacterium]
MSDFDKVIDRRNTYSLKWEVAENELPMWVADMDFQTAPEIIEVLTERAKFGVFGYSIVPDEWYSAIINWWSKRHNFNIKKEWLQFCTGTVTAITCAVKRITNIGDNVVVQTPVYNIFFNSIENHGRHVFENKLKYNNGEYSMDFNDLEEKLSNPLTTMMILCNPQNPGGKIWSKEELKKIGELCNKYNVTVISDEVHCDLTEPGYEYVPFASASEICGNLSITCISPSKTFNIAGLHSAAVVIPNLKLRNIMVRGLNSDEIAEPNIFAVDGVVAAYTKGEKWLDELRLYISENKRIVNEFLKNELPEMTAAKSDATYLMWLDCHKIIGNTSELCRFIRKENGLYLSNGLSYKGNGDNFMRMNVACPKSKVFEGLSRLKAGVTAYEKYIEKQC